MKFKDAVTYAVKNFSSVTFINRIKEEDDTMLKHLNILKEINKSQEGNHGIEMLQILQDYLKMF
jgi:hypothetical protein